VNVLIDYVLSEDTERHNNLTPDVSQPAFLSYSRLEQPSNTLLEGSGATGRMQVCVRLRSLETPLLTIQVQSTRLQCYTYCVCSEFNVKCQLSTSQNCLIYRRFRLS